MLWFWGGKGYARVRVTVTRCGTVSGHRPADCIFLIGRGGV